MQAPRMKTVTSFMTRGYVCGNGQHPTSAGTCTSLSLDTLHCTVLCKSTEYFVHRTYTCTFAQHWTCSTHTSTVLVLSRVTLWVKKRRRSKWNNTFEKLKSMRQDTAFLCRNSTSRKYVFFVRISVNISVLENSLKIHTRGERAHE